jgi:hypothetical protein
MIGIVFVAAFLAISGWVHLAQAQHVIVLKNGRQITVQSYREEGSMIKFNGLGGEIGLPKEQVQAILKPGQSNRPGVSISDLETPSRPSPTVPQKAAASPPPAASRPPSSPSDAVPARGDEAKEYNQRLAELTRKLETANREYFEATQGGGTGSNVSKEGFRGWAMDIASRIHDSQKVPGGGGDTNTPPMPPYAPVYTAKEKELSDLRAQIDSLQKERDALIEEMKLKGILSR